MGRSPHGERGLKLEYNGKMSLYKESRSPHGERGLKPMCKWSVTKSG